MGICYFWPPLLDSNQRPAVVRWPQSAGQSYDPVLWTFAVPDECPRRERLRPSSTSAHKAMPLHLPPAAGHSFGYLLRYAQSVKRWAGNRKFLDASASRNEKKQIPKWVSAFLSLVSKKTGRKTEDFIIL